MDKSLQTKLLRLSIKAAVFALLLPPAWGMGFEALPDSGHQWSASSIKLSLP